MQGNDPGLKADNSALTLTLGRALGSRLVQLDAMEGILPLSANSPGLDAPGPVDSAIPWCR